MSEGQACQFYFYGWRFGIIRHIPIKGQHKGDARIEIPVDLWSLDAMGKRRWVPKPHVKVWVPMTDVNEVGDTCYHGPKLSRVVEERAEEKAEQQKKADKIRTRAARFHR